ncbi:hypothetical protein BOX15_Mlig015668g1 [Macrostomum lignano]|uniref:B-cell CLL/lymphoma 7 protein family member A n=2 Tax=Macrostomum lignano TaxID=282301 RepID=A0A267F5V1_9PLAT|nr:hypothetical protein BOX15_Mlig026371g1 [Macrostomum lignano]PAA69116.1 hypothetical protein BOX15_Mlig015668g1 [Macrostomum lignano]
MFSRGLRSETRSKAKEDLKKIVSTIEHVRKWEKKWVHIKDTSLTVYKWIPSAEQNFTRHKPKPYQVSDKARFALSGPEAASSATPDEAAAAAAVAAAAADADAAAAAVAVDSAAAVDTSSIIAPMSSASAVAAAASSAPTGLDVDLDSANGDSNIGLGGSLGVGDSNNSPPTNLLMDDDSKSGGTEFTAGSCQGPGGPSEDNTNSDLMSACQDASQDGPPAAKRTKQDF